MRGIGGLVQWSREPDPAAAASLRAMAVRAVGSRTAVCAAQGPVGLFHSAGRDRIEWTDGIQVVADLDLLNLEALEPAGTGDGESSRLVAGLYEREGPDFVRRLRGSFAIALWDNRRRRLLLAVDHFGIKRLHYAADARRVAFASRPSALMAASQMVQRVDPGAVFSYLNFGFIPGPGSPFTGVRRVPPGHLVLVTEDSVTVQPYWDMQYIELPVSVRDGARQVFAATEAAVGRALRGTVPGEIGAFLSGGTDSSTVVGLASRVTGARISAFSIGFHEAHYDELHYAEVAARYFGASHRTQVVKPAEALEALPRLVEAYDEPFGNNSAIGTYVCARLARECGASRLLAGDGGDEIFGGNERYRTDRVFARYHRLPPAVRHGLVEPVLSRLPGKGPVGMAQRYVRRASIPNPRRFYSYEFFFAQEGAALLSPDFLASIDPEAPLALVESHYDRVTATSELNRLLYLDLKLTIGDNDLLKVTRTADLADVDVRFPLLDVELAELTGTLPASLKVRGLEKRYLFKQAFRELLPAEILAKRKHGFGVPTAAWLRQDPGFQSLAQDTLRSARARHRGYFRRGATERLLDLHLTDTTSYYGDILWTVLMLELWHRRHVDVGGSA